MSVFGRPAAITTMSAWQVYLAISGVPVWQIVTVAFAPFALLLNSTANGRPTSVDRPTTTTCLPAGSLPVRVSI